MKLIRGGTLSDRLKSARMTTEEAAGIMAKVAAAVGHAHEKGILHRDLKPSNILLDLEGHPWLTDFGMARLSGTDAALTVTGAVAAHKEYDKTAAATVSGATLAGVIAGDTVNLTNHVTGTFSQVNVGTGLAVTTVMALTGTHAANYSVSQPTLTADITPKTLGLSGITVTDKNYDQTTAATVSGGTIAGVIAGDTVTLDLSGVTGTFANPAAANGKTVNITGLALAGSEAAN